MVQRHEQNTDNDVARMKGKHHVNGDSLHVELSQTQSVIFNVTLIDILY